MSIWENFLQDAFTQRLSLGNLSAVMKEELFQGTEIPSASRTLAVLYQGLFPWEASESRQAQRFKIHAAFVAFLHEVIPLQ